jgi:hypothetical protein
VCRYHDQLFPEHHCWATHYRHLSWLRGEATCEGTATALTHRRARLMCESYRLEPEGNVENPSIPCLLTYDRSLPCIMRGFAHTAEQSDFGGEDDGCNEVYVYQ